MLLLRDQVQLLIELDYYEYINKNGCYYSPKPRSLDGPNMKSAIVAIKKDEPVTYFLSITLVKSPIKGDEIA